MHTAARSNRGTPGLEHIAPQEPKLPLLTLFLWALPHPSFCQLSIDSSLSRHPYRLSFSFLQWPAIQILIQLRRGRTTSPTRITPIVLPSPQQRLRPPHRYSLWKRPHLRAPSRPRPVGRARHGTARMKTRTSTLRAVTFHIIVIQPRRTKRLSSHHTHLALNYDPNYLPKPSPFSLDSTRGEHND